MTATLLLAAPAQAAPTVTCTHASDGAAMTIVLGGDGVAVAAVRRNGINIEVNGSPCGATVATVNNTPSIDIQQSSVTSQVTIDLRGGALADNLGGEVFIQYREVGNSSFTSWLTVRAPDTGSHLVVGQLGVNLNADEANPDPDLTTETYNMGNLTGTIDRRDFVGGDGVDRMTLGGGSGTGAPLPAFGGVFGELRGGAGDDELIGSPAFSASGEGDDDTLTARNTQGGGGNDTLTGMPDQFNQDFLDGGTGNDTLFGLAGPDNLWPGAGNDNVFAGPGSDTIDEEMIPGDGDDRIAPGPGADSDVIRAGDGFDTYVGSDAEQGVRVDLGAGAVAQDTGQGFASIEHVEAVEGSPFADTLIGTAGADELGGLGGDDVIRGRGGADDLDGGDGADTASYEDAAAAVTADLAAGTAMSGGTAQLAAFERLAGGPQADTLRGTAGPDDIQGGGGDDDIDPRGGSDVVGGGAGADTLRLEDGAVDTGDCGDGVDTADIDEADLLTACETVLIPPLVVVLPPPPPACQPQPEIPANGIDENCDGADAPAPLLGATVRSTFAVFRTFTQVRRLLARNVPAGATLEIRCKGRGCPFKRKTRAQAKAVARLNLVKAFKLGRARLRPKAVLEVRITAPASVGKAVVFRIRDLKLPTSRNLCLPPGAAKGVECV
jgi:Ca2+-binding RTX toxin-like protein